MNRGIRYRAPRIVPEHDAANTKRIFSLLAELLALKTMANELAITPLVRVVP